MRTTPDVAGRMEGVLLRALGANGYDVGPVVARLPVSLESLDARDTWISWDDHLALLERAADLCGDRDGLIALGRSMTNPDILGPHARLFSVLPHRRMYELMVRFVGPSAFRPVTARFSLDGDGAFRIAVVIDERYEGSLPFFHILHGSFESVPRLVGLPDALVSADVSAHAGTFRVVPPPSRSILGWPGRVWRSLAGSGSMIDELANQHQELRRSLRELDAANRRLAAEEERFRRLAENSSDIITEWDEAGRCHYASPSVTRLLGFTPAEFRARTDVLVHPDDRSALNEARHNRDRGAEPVRAMFRIVHADGSWRWFEGASTPFTTSSGDRRAVTVARDVTERVALEEQLLQAQKMEAIGRLAGGVAHDFNNLLMVIVDSTDRLVEGLERMTDRSMTSRGPAGADAEPMLHAAQNARGAADRAAGLTKSLLAFSRRQPVRARVLDFNAIVGDMSTILRRILGEDVELSIATAPTEFVVEADPSQLEQVLVNLAANARDAMADGGRLEIALDEVDLDPRDLRRLGADQELRPGPFVRLRVADEGRGMSGETRSHAFEPFFTTKSAGDSVGLGLSTVYGIVRRSRGVVEITSEPQAGTTVDVYLPRSDAPVEAVSEPRSPDRPSAARDERVLLVEDEAAVREIVQRMLEADGYEVVTAGEGRQALADVADRIDQFDLLITDVVMPEMSGPDLVGALREIRPDLKVLYISGYAGDPDVSSADADPGTESLSKPFGRADLIAKVETLVRAPAPRA